MKRNAFCQVLCRRVLTDDEAKLLRDRVEQEYKVNFIVDNLPAAVRMVNEENPDDVRYERGFPLGMRWSRSESEAPQHFLFNHLHFIISTHQEAEAGSRIVGFEVEPFTVRHDYEGTWSDASPPQLRTCNDAAHVTRSMTPQSIDRAGEVIFTYDVEWIESDIKWSNRWDLYLRGTEDVEVHWFSIVNSVLIVFFLTGMIAMILIRVLHSDISRINDEEEEDETSWKLVHGDVFRPPAGFFGPMFLSVFVGSGIQILMMALCVMVFAVLGVLSPANRGSLLTALLLLFIFMGSFAGFASSRIYKMFHGKAWKRNTVLTALVFPSTVAFGVLLVNFFVWAEQSSAAIPFGTFVALGLLWFGVSLPLVFLGSYIGFTRDAVKPPVRVSTFSRMIPPQPWYLHPLITCLAGGVLPFGAVFIELNFVMGSLWLSQSYYLFGFLALVLLILIITCAEISIVMCYFQLCAEDYNWWWRSFLTSATSGIYVFLYATAYFTTNLSLTSPTSVLVFFGYMGMISWTFFLLTGTIGFLATLYFVRTIFSQIKVD